MALTSEQGYKTPAGGPPPGAQGEGESADIKMTDLDAHKKELIMQAVQEAIKGKREGGPSLQESVPAGRPLPPDEQQVQLV